ncbi:hypothetical protein GCM10027162_44530 [Streptomyces incanus]
MRYLVRQFRGTRAVAGALGVSRRTVGRYVKGRIHRPRNGAPGAESGLAVVEVTAADDERWLCSRGRKGTKPRRRLRNLRAGCGTRGWYAVS